MSSSVSLRAPAICMKRSVLVPLLSFLLFVCYSSRSETNGAFDGKRWNLSTGNLSVSYIQASPIGAFPRTNYLEAPPSVESQIKLKHLGAVANEDYIAWGSVERSPGNWEWAQHDAMERTLTEAGLKYVVYNWAHFPPTWLRDQREKRTLMKCLEHGEETLYLSIFDPRTIEWYDHFYKNVHKHFGDRVDDIYACILGPYGEGNYPLRVPDWVNMGHCHEGYWCGDKYAVASLQKAMQAKYKKISKLNEAWGLQLTSFEELIPPAQIAKADFKPSLQAFTSAAQRRQWLDFITWYHQAIVDFSEKSLNTVLKYYPADKVRLKPGGNYGSVNPLPWGTYCPAYAKMAKRYKVVLQPADCQGAIFGDKWVGTAYQFYGVKECTEPAGDLGDKAFVQRMFSDASSGAAELFTYDYLRHSTNVQKYIHLYTGKSGDTEIAVLCPTTLYRLGVNLHPTIEASYPLRDICEYDVLDELLIADGALTTRRYKTLILFQCEIIDQPILDKIESFRRAGGKVIVIGKTGIHNVEGQSWIGNSRVKRVSPLSKERRWVEDLNQELSSYKGFEGNSDGLWTSRRGSEVFVFNSNTKRTEVKIGTKLVRIAPHTIYSRIDDK